MRIVCWQTILMKYQSLFHLKIREDVAKCVMIGTLRFKETWHLLNSFNLDECKIQKKLLYQCYM